MKTQTVAYGDGKVTLEGYLAYDDTTSEKRPCVLIAPTFVGRNEFVRKKAEALAELGYAGFALDMYGHGHVGKNPEENSKLMAPFMKDRALLRQRITAALKAVQSLPMVDAHQVAAMGFCFGGLCVLDLARSGAPVKGVISFHGLLPPPKELPPEKIQAKILVLHGHDDPMVPPDQVLAFEKEMTAAGVDWQVHAYGHTVHAFTNPVANDPIRGTVYHPTADRRSWESLKQFLEEIFQ